MGYGYAVLVWDSWGVGLHRVNPRLIELGDDKFRPTNHMSCERDTTDKEIDEKHKLTEKYGNLWQVIR